MDTDEQIEAEGVRLQAAMKAWLLEWVGERCPDFCPGCYICECWKAWDLLFSEVEK